MMDASVVKGIVTENIEGLMREVGVPHWRIDVLYEGLDDGVVAHVDFRNVDRWRAEIVIDPAKCESYAHVIHTLRHELLHLLAAPFIIYRNVMRAGFDHNSDEGSRENRLWKHAMEQQVVMLERGLAARLAPDEGAE
jgi:hypothetical protein